MATSIQPNILVIEDDPYLADIFETKLRKSNFIVRVSSDGLEALTQVDEKKPDVILLDLMLPHINGYDVLKTPKCNPDTDKIPVFIVSNLDQKEAQQKGLTIGADKYFIKAKTDLNELIVFIKEACTHHAD